MSSQPLSFPPLHVLLVLLGWTGSQWVGSLGDILHIGEAPGAQSRAENGSGGEQMENDQHSPRGDANLSMSDASEFL